jgi:hypothetical protein
MRKALIVLIVLLVPVFLAAACTSGPEGGQASAGDSSKSKALSKKELAALENKLIVELTALNPDSLGNGRILGRVVNLTDQNFERIEVWAVSDDEANPQRVGRTTVEGLAKKSEVSFSISTPVSISELGKKGTTLKIKKAMVGR